MTWNTDRQTRRTHRACHCDAWWLKNTGARVQLRVVTESPPSPLCPVQTDLSWASLRSKSRSPSRACACNNRWSVKIRSFELFAVIVFVVPVVLLISFTRIFSWVSFLCSCLRSPPTCLFCSPCFRFHCLFVSVSFSCALFYFERLFQFCFLPPPSGTDRLSPVAPSQHFLSWPTV